MSARCNTDVWGECSLAAVVAGGTRVQSGGGLGGGTLTGVDLGGGGRRGGVGVGLCVCVCGLVSACALICVCLCACVRMLLCVYMDDCVCVCIRGYTSYCPMSPNAPPIPQAESSCQVDLPVLHSSQRAVCSVGRDTCFVRECPVIIHDHFSIQD